MVRAARAYGIRPSKLLGLKNEWLALAFDLGMAVVSETKTQENTAIIRAQVESKGGAFPVISINEMAKD